MDIPVSTAAILSSWPIDWVLLSLVAAILMLECYVYGSTRTNAISISFPVTYILMSWLPSTIFLSTILPQMTLVPAKAALFATVLGLVYMIVHKVIFSFDSGSGDIPQAMISGVATTAVVAVFWILTPGLRELWQFSPQIQLLFGESFRVFWLAGALGALAYVRV